MRWVKVTAIISLWAFFFALVALAHVWISVARLPNRWKIISRLMRNLTLLLRTIFNIRVTVVGEEGQLAKGGYVIISNHVSYLDGFVIGSLFPVVFVSKKEVKSWPVIGLWTTLCGTVYIDRQRKNLLPLLVGEISRKLKQGANILLFPEGTSTNGEGILPFQTAPMAAPLRSRAIIVPLRLTYKTVEGQPVSAANRDLVYWYGDMDFLTHFWKLLALRGVEVRVTIHPSIDCSHYNDNSAGRKQLARDCYDRVLGKVAAEFSDQDKAENRAAENSRALLSS
jgi:lyso-ornithine lipid O-acyltransferase